MFVQWTTNRYLFHISKTNFWVKIHFKIKPLGTIDQTDQIIEVGTPHCSPYFALSTVYMVIFANFASQSSRKFPLQYMAIYSNENIKKITKLSRHKFPHLVQNRENICTQIYMAYTV